jgi:protein-disulfide isomerase
MSPRALLLAALLATAALAAPTPARADHPSFDPAAVYKVPLGHGPSRGPATAPVTIVEWSDFACRYCNRVIPTLEQLDRLYPGRLRWVYRQFPLDSDQTLAAEASLAAAAQGTFWPMHDRLFAVHGRVDRASVEMMAADLGLDMNRFRGDLDAGTYRGAVQADLAAAVRLGVTGTPSFFIDGRPVHGNKDLRTFTTVIDEELARAAAARKAGTAAAGLYDALVAAGHPTADAPPEAGDPPRFELDPDKTYQIGLGLPGHQVGPDDALVTVVEWSDFECPYCARNAPDLERLRKAYAGRVRIIYRHMPLPFHRRADLAAEAGVEAAHQGKFWAFHDRLFADPGHVDRADLEAAAQGAGLDMTAFRAALDDRRWRDAVAADGAAGAIAGVTGTPTMFINGAPLVGAVGYARIQAAVDVRLAQAQALVDHGVAPGDVYAVIEQAAEDGERGDPSRMPAAGTVRLELAPVDREEAVVAACRDHDPARAAGLASRLTGDRKRDVTGACAAYGIDLPGRP